METTVQISEDANRFLGFSVETENERIIARFKERFACEPAIIATTMNMKIAGPIPEN